MKVVGLSISFCVADIARGFVPEDKVDQIIAGTKVDPEDWSRLIKTYNEYYWHKLPEAENILRRLFEAGKIDQPRIRGEEPPNIARGHWLIDNEVIFDIREVDFNNG